MTKYISFCKIVEEVRNKLFYNLSDVMTDSIGWNNSYYSVLSDVVSNSLPTRILRAELAEKISEL